MRITNEEIEYIELRSPSDNEPILQETNREDVKLTSSQKDYIQNANFSHASSSDHEEPDWSDFEASASPEKTGNNNTNSSDHEEPDWSDFETEPASQSSERQDDIINPSSSGDKKSSALGELSPLPSYIEKIEGNTRSYERARHVNSSGSSSGEETNAERTVKKRRFRINYYLNGSWLHPVLRGRNVLLVIFIVFLLVCDTYLGYLRINKIKKIDRLERELREISNKQLFLFSEICNTDQEATVAQRLQQKGSTLAPTTEPPYIILYDGQKEAETNKKNDQK